MNDFSHINPICMACYHQQGQCLQGLAPVKDAAGLDFCFSRAEVPPMPVELEAAESSAASELAAVKAATALRQPGALARAYIRQATGLRNGLGIRADLVDLYCIGRLNLIARSGIPADAVFLATAAAQLHQLLKG